MKFGNWVFCALLLFLINTVVGGEEFEQGQRSERISGEFIAFFFFFFSTFQWILVLLCLDFLIGLMVLSLEVSNSTLV